MFTRKVSIELFIILDKFRWNVDMIQIINYINTCFRRNIESGPSYALYPFLKGYRPFLHNEIQIIIKHETVIFIGKTLLVGHSKKGLLIKVNGPILEKKLVSS